MVKIVLIGAGSAQFGAVMLGDIFQSPALKGAEIVLNDINEEAAGRTLKTAEDYIADGGLDFSVSADADLSAAVKGADFAVISIEPGDRFALWDMDWRIPQQYGVTQVYGENGGPGGLFHSLRIIPPILEICGKIAEAAPDAVIFNYSNPMSRICTAVNRKFPDLNFIGMCHEIASLERHLPPMLEQPRENISFRAAGLNHFSVLAEARYVDSGEDAYPDVRARAESYFGAMPGYSEMLTAARAGGAAVETEGWMDIDLSHLNGVRPWSDRRLFRDILRRFGCLPVTTDSHFGEYIQWAHDAADLRGITDFYTYYRSFLGRGGAEIRPGLHERAAPIMEGVAEDSGYEEPAVNIPNKGLIEDLPEWITVEAPAVISKDGVQGIPVGLPAGVRGLLANQIGVHNMTAEAALHGSRELAVQALLVDPVVTVSKGIPEMVDHMIAEQSPWLDYLK